MASKPVSFIVVAESLTCVLIPNEYIDDHCEELARVPCSSPSGRLLRTLRSQALDGGNSVCHTNSRPGLTTAAGTPSYNTKYCAMPMQVSGHDNVDLFKRGDGHT